MGQTRRRGPTWATHVLDSVPCDLTVAGCGESWQRTGEAFENLTIGVGRGLERLIWPGGGRVGPWRARECASRNRSSPEPDGMGSGVVEEFVGERERER